MSMPMPHPEAPSVKKTNWWLIGCGGCLTLIVLGILGCVALFFGVTKVIKSTEPYKTAVSVATNSPEVQAKLGTPIKPGWMVQGSVNSNVSDGANTETANLTIPLKGSKASASLHYVATRKGTTWEVSEFTVTVDGSGETISLAQ